VSARRRPANVGLLVAACALTALLGRQQAPDTGVDPLVLDALRGDATSRDERVDKLLRRHGFPQAEREDHVKALKAILAYDLTGTDTFDLRPGWEQRLAAVERSCEILRAGAAQTFPAPLWSPDFARARSDVWPLRRVERAALDTRHRAMFEAIIDESALFTPHGGRAAIARQLDHVLQLIRDGRAAVQIVPTASGVVTPTVTVARIAGQALVIADAGFSGVGYSTDPRFVAEVEAQLDAAEAVALSAEESVAALETARAHYRYGRPVHLPRLHPAAAQENT
jgi:hypothetical protein